MYAIAFDLVVDDAASLHPKNVRTAYLDVERTLGLRGFTRIQGSVYVTDDENMLHVTRAMTALKALPWFSGSVRDVWAFRVEQWSDFTPFFQDQDTAA